MRLHWFQLTAYGILALFMGILLYVTVHAFTRNSGSTGQDMANIQKLRYDAVLLLKRAVPEVDSVPVDPRKLLKEE